MELANTHSPRECIATIGAFIFLILISSFTLGGDLNNSLVERVRNEEISISDILALIELDRSNEKIGYGFCVSAGGSPSGVSNVCNPNGSVGYGLCVIGGGSPNGVSNVCNPNGSVGYGLCVIGGGSPNGVSSVCNPNGSAGYGLCVIGGGNPNGVSSVCNPNGSAGYGLCVIGGSSSGGTPDLCETTVARRSEHISDGLMGTHLFL